MVPSISDELDVAQIVQSLVVPDPSVPLGSLGSAVPGSFPIEALLELAQVRGPGLLDGLLSEEPGPSELSHSLAARFSQYVRRHNQYLEVTLEHQGLLASEYESLLAELQRILRSHVGPEVMAAGVHRLLASHHRRLEALVRGLWPGPSSAEAFVDSEPVCEEYSPDLQLAVLGIHPSDLSEPVLDVGCGTEGALVHHLREQGVDAMGIDLSATGEPPLVQADWMTFAFGESRWGSVIAHLSFTNHFVLQDRVSEEHAERYALVYMKILRSLRDGGAFYYAPGVPFIEQHLPGHFQVTRYPVATMAGPPAALSELPVPRWQETLCSVRVRRLR